MNKHMSPKNVHQPLSNYSHCVLTPSNANWLAISGQVGIDAKGKVAKSIEKQCEQALRNVVNCLRANGMNKKDLVKLTSYIVDPRYVQALREARLKILGEDCTPTSTLLVIDALAAPELLVEVEAWAAKV